MFPVASDQFIRPTSVLGFLKRYTGLHLHKLDTVRALGKWDTEMGKFEFEINGNPYKQKRLLPVPPVGAQQHYISDK